MEAKTTEQPSRHHEQGAHSLSLDVVIATFNRSALLRECLASLFNATAPSLMRWRVSVVDNNSSDDTKATVESFMADPHKPIRYLFERMPGKSAALNLAIASCPYTIMGFLDDDEQVDENWLVTIERTFRECPELDFIGGPYLGLWRANKPDWLPSGFNGVLGADNVEKIPREPVPFPQETLFLRGGNAVVRRSVFDRIGNYAVRLGRFENGLGSCEDADMYDRMLDAKLHGLYMPGLIVYHLVPPERLTRSYYRKWTWGHGVSLSEMYRTRPPQVPHIGRIPRWAIGNAVRRIPALLFGDKPERFSAELQWWTLAGLYCGAYWKRSAKFGPPT
jgi:glucosyl-dolichyl phosphate glucuronosyltransferase